MMIRTVYPHYLGQMGYARNVPQVYNIGQGCHRLKEVAAEEGSGNHSLLHCHQAVIFILT